MSDPDPQTTKYGEDIRPFLPPVGERLTLPARERLLRSALHDAEQAVECLRAGDVLSADILLKLAVDQIDETGIIP